MPGRGRRHDAGVSEKISAGILLYRRRAGETEIFLVHPGGPFWAKKDQAAWSIPKGLCEPGEDPSAAARREFREETGQTMDGDLRALGVFRQSGGKTVAVFLAEGDCDADAIRSNLFEMEWPPHSGKTRPFAEADRAAWFTLKEAEAKLHKGLRPIVAALRENLAGRGR